MSMSMENVLYLLWVQRLVASTVGGLRHALLYVLAQLAAPAASAANDGAPASKRMCSGPVPASSNVSGTSSTCTSSSSAHSNSSPTAGASSSSCSSPHAIANLFDFAILEEAGQVSEPLAIGVLLHAQRFVLVGDVRQLPPIVRSAYASYVHCIWLFALTV